MSRRAFTLIECLAVMMVLVVGLLSAIAVIRYGVRLARDAQAAALAMPTAMTVMRDVRPLGVTATDFAPAGTDAWQGYVNGMWVRRTIYDKEVKGGQTFATVHVEVFWGSESSRALSMTERMAFHAP